MTHDGRMVANFVLDFSQQRGLKITNLALQKIVYFCHVWSLLLLQQPLIKHKFEAWEFGPVLPYLYREFKEFGDAEVNKRATYLDPQDGQRKLAEYQFDMTTDRLLRNVVNFYSRLSAGDLVRLTHAKGGPWDKTWHHQEPINPGMKIDDVEIANFYSKVPPPFLIQ